MEKSLSFIYKRLIWRNRIITILRFFIPLGGIFILALLVMQLFIANIGKNYNISGIRIEREKIIIETPQYNGSMANGTNYSISSETASTNINNRDAFDLSKAKFDMTRKDGLTMLAVANQALYDLIKETVYIKGEMIVNDARGIKAKLNNNIIEWSSQTLETKDSVEIEFSDGSKLFSKTLIYDAKAKTYKFKDVTLILKEE